ncbi:G-protein coupled receptor 35-like [Anolis carolinensis]|uniref:G-protein coupled receptors family 1 profile domain-containing protein n=1 Tax=Anolis carolinensis TaxID=28377 RepID=G1KX02_ANOCA|nr:PREDICTED: G-protein coupled receptor 35 isoform X1 [Anolis carolinensis]|eukprot:XP_003218387.2 PREDICTED: G-protein coupled receptor 35 isoform X1 [Anolis carolinensis]
MSGMSDDGKCKLPIDGLLMTFEVIFYSLFTFFGIIFNTIALWVFCFRFRKWTEPRIYMISLALADYTLVLTLPFIMYFHKTNWPTDSFCLVILIIHCINMPMSISTITLIALDRYVAIKHPLKAKVIRSPRKAAIISLFFWICCFIYGITLLSLSGGNEICFFQFSDGQSLHHIPIKFTIFFCIPLVILLFCSTQVIRCLKKKQNASLHEEKLTQKAILVISVNLGTFIICFLPFNISLLLQYIMNAADCEVRRIFSNTTHATSFMANLNCCLDAICYYLVAKEFQEAASLLPALKSMQSKSNLTEMQSKSNLTEDLQL